MVTTPLFCRCGDDSCLMSSFLLVSALAFGLLSTGGGLNFVRLFVCSLGSCIVAVVSVLHLRLVTLSCLVILLVLLLAGVRAQMIVGPILGIFVTQFGQLFGILRELLPSAMIIRESSLYSM